MVCCVGFAIWHLLFSWFVIRFDIIILPQMRTLRLQLRWRSIPQYPQYRQQQTQCLQSLWLDFQPRLPPMLQWGTFSIIVYNRNWIWFFDVFSFMWEKSCTFVSKFNGGKIYGHNWKLKIEKMKYCLNAWRIENWKLKIEKLLPHPDNYQLSTFNSQLLSNQTIKQSSKLDYIIKHIKSLIIYNITCEMM